VIADARPACRRPPMAHALFFFLHLMFALDSWLGSGWQLMHCKTFPLKTSSFFGGAAVCFLYRTHRQLGVFLAPVRFSTCSKIVSDRRVVFVFVVVSFRGTIKTRP
jgi:hypothetical protein